MAAGIVIKTWKPLRKNSLLGFAEVAFQSGLVIAEVCIMQGEHGPWANPPSRPMVGRDGRALTDERGKVRYQPLISFSSKEIKNRWSDGVIAAMQEQHPEAFE